MKKLEVTSLLVERLEHIPVDSIWAHRASGIRGSLMRMIECLEAGEAIEPQKVIELCQLGFEILEKSAKENF